MADDRLSGVRERIRRLQSLNGYFTHFDVMLVNRERATCLVCSPAAPATDEEHSGGTSLRKHSATWNLHTEPPASIDVVDIKADPLVTVTEWNNGNDSIHPIEMVGEMCDTPTAFTVDMNRLKMADVHQHPLLCTNVMAMLENVQHPIFAEHKSEIDDTMQTLRRIHSSALSDLLERGEAMSATSSTSNTSISATMDHHQHRTSDPNVFNLRRHSLLLNTAAAARPFALSCGAITRTGRPTSTSAENLSHKVMDNSSDNESSASGSRDRLPSVTSNHPAGALSMLTAMFRHRATMAHTNSDAEDPYRVMLNGESSVNNVNIV